MVNDGKTRFADDITLQELVRLRVENERLREALEKIASQDTPRSEGTKYRDDGKYSKLDKCTHGLFMYEDCDQCISDFARAALKESE